MSTVAEQLRAAREAKNLTVEQVADLTKIRTDHIRALEEGDFDVFSAPIYIRGSVKNYASALKLDTAALLATLDAELGKTENFSEPPPLTEQKQTMVDHLTLLFAKINWKVAFVVVALMAMVLIVIASVLALKHHNAGSPPKNLKPAVYQSSNSGDTLPLPKR
jgi:cytoskeletal protein RodZ